jgi:hypothetical protein
MEKGGQVARYSCVQLSLMHPSPPPHLPFHSWASVSQPTCVKFVPTRACGVTSPLHSLPSPPLYSLKLLTHSPPLLHFVSFTAGLRSRRRLA